MLDIKYLRKNKEEASKKLQDRGVEEGTLDTLLEKDQKRRDLIAKVEEMKAKRNEASDKIAFAKRQKEDASAAIAEMQEVAKQIKDMDQELADAEAAVKEIATHLPNIAEDDVPVGPDEDSNVEVRKWAPADYATRPHALEKAPEWLKPHYEIGEDLGILDFERGAKVSGARFLYYVGDGARLERALYNFMLDQHREEEIGRAHV